MKGFALGLRLLVDGVEGVYLEMVARQSCSCSWDSSPEEDVIIAIGLEEGLMLSYCALVGHEEICSRSHTSSTPWRYPLVAWSYRPSSGFGNMKGKAVELPSCHGWWMPETIKKW